MNNENPTPYPLDSRPINISLIDKNDQPISCKLITCIDNYSRRIRGYGTIPTNTPLDGISFDDIIWFDDEIDEEE